MSVWGDTRSPTLARAALSAAFGDCRAGLLCSSLSGQRVGTGDQWLRAFYRLRGTSWDRPTGWVYMVVDASRTRISEDPAFMGQFLSRHLLVRKLFSAKLCTELSFPCNLKQSTSASMNVPIVVS